MQSAPMAEQQIHILEVSGSSFDQYRASDELRMQVRQKHMAGQTIEAITLPTEAIRQDPGNTRIATDRVQVFLDIDELEQARALFNKLPGRDKQSDTGQVLIGQLTFRALAAGPVCCRAGSIRR